MRDMRGEAAERGPRYLETLSRRPLLRQALPQRLPRNKMTSRSQYCSRCAGILAGWFVLLLALAVDGGTAFAPPQKKLHVPKGCSQNKNLGLCQSNNRNALHPLSANKSTPTADDDVVVHAISLAFLAEQEASGKVLTNHDQNWWKRFEELEEYKKLHGDCNVPHKFDANPQLGKWVYNQRQSYKKNKLSSERVEALESLGFEWTRPKGKEPDDDSAWWKRFAELEEYKKEHGDCNVPQKFDANPQLGRWVNAQRRQYKKNKLESDRSEALEKIGFEWTRLSWNRDDDKWWKHFAELNRFEEKHGDCNVPIHYQANPQLAKWVMNQRAYYHRFIDENWKRSPGITKERIEALNKIGFEWRLRERPEWDERYDELVIYKEEHGDTLVPTDARGDSGNKYRELAMWVNTQRREYRLLQEGKHSQITGKRIEKLEAIGFVWYAQEAAWEEKFAELVEFKASHGHTDVPRSWENKSLHNWVNRQRRFYKKLKEGKPTLTEERIERLESIGFEWRSKNTYQWMIRLGELRDFYDENGVVPIPQAEHPTLYNWASTQKKEYDKFVRGEKTNMDEDRIKDLESIGFFDVYGK